MNGTTLDEELAVVTRGTLEVEGRLVEASNTTVRCVATLDGVSVRCVYKPIAGERPLWDFPDGTLAGREVAAYLLSAAGGFDVVPPTVLRDGPFGRGACQVWVEPTGPALVGFVPAEQLPVDWCPIAAATDGEGGDYLLAHADDPLLARLAVFDVVINNADRKGGHVLTTSDGRLYGVDHGVSFHAAPKLRTVLWGWAGQPVSAESQELLASTERALAGAPGAALGEHLGHDEVAATAARVTRLRQRGRFPVPPQAGPVIPWPPM